MDFGKLPAVDHVDFSLPPDHPENAAILERYPKTGTPAAVYLGATGYNMKSWVGQWYPPGTRDKEMLTAYGRQFNTIEHNTTHYRIPDSATVARWREETPQDFRFCPKVPQVISHARHLNIEGRALTEFCAAIEGLEERLGCCFMQLPPYFDVYQIRVLDRFLDHWPDHLPLAIEVRHPSFFEPEMAAESFFQLLAERQVTAVITDVAGRRDVCHMRLTTARTIVRFVGNGLHPTDYTRVQEWASRLKSWIHEGLREIYFFTHEPDNLLAPDLARYAADVFVSTVEGIRIRGPQPLPPAAFQGSLFD